MTLSYLLGAERRLRLSSPSPCRCVCLMLTKQVGTLCLGVITAIATLALKIITHPLGWVLAWKLGFRSHVFTLCPVQAVLVLPYHPILVCLVAAYSLVFHGMLSSCLQHSASHFVVKSCGSLGVLVSVSPVSSRILCSVRQCWMCSGIPLHIDICARCSLASLFSVSIWYSATQF